ncbi:ABC transporter substrate-binding protein [Phenylobacterium sp.]|uniref:ABC transporter substrate-binding protein n=1 Tax=Phenylobacterium sp. TaxID=1871053 RepID=UPI0028A12BE7|nr:ABC transporter substrate-binding protein [Phenylobacterium sp.]
MIRLKAFPILAAALVASLALTACGKDAAPAGPKLALDAPLPETIPAGTKLVIGDPTTQRVVELNGWDKDLPFQIEWAQISGGPAVTEAFHAKALDVGSAANIPPIHAIWVGIPVKMIAVRLRKDHVNFPLFELGIAPKAGIKSLADLRGKKIAYSPGQVQGEVVLRTLAAVGLTQKDVTLVELPSTGDVYPNALVSGLVDVAPLGAGVATKRYLDNYARDGAQVLRHPPYRDDLTNLYVRAETLHDPAKAAALRAYVKLWARAVEWQATHKAEWRDAYYVRQEGLSPEDAEFVVRAAGDPVIPRDWTEAIGMQQSSIDFLAKEGGQKRFDAAEIFDRRFEALAAEAAPKIAVGPAPAQTEGKTNP